MASRIVERRTCVNVAPILGDAILKKIGQQLRSYYEVRVAPEPHANHARLLAMLEAKERGDAV